MKNCKIFCKAQTASRLKEIIQPLPIPLPLDKTLLRLWNKNFLKEVQRNIQIFDFKVLQECSSWVSRNDAVQIFFLTPHRNMFARKFVKPESFLAVFGSILFLLSSELRMTEVFLAKLYCKMCDLFCQFLLFLRLSARSFEIKKISDYVLWNVWTNIKTLYAQNSNFVFFGTAIGLFSQSFFYRPMVADITLPPPPPTHHEKASYGPPMLLAVGEFHDQI